MLILPKHCGERASMSDVMRRRRQGVGVACVTFKFVVMHVRVRFGFVRPCNMLTHPSATFLLRARSSYFSHLLV
jgi:hypothetical protein